MKTEMAFDQFCNQTVQRSAGSGCLLQHMVTVLALENGSFQSLDLALNTPDTTQQFVIICYVRHTRGQYISLIRTSCSEPMPGNNICFAP